MTLPACLAAVSFPSHHSKMMKHDVLACSVLTLFRECAMVQATFKWLILSRNVRNDWIYFWCFCWKVWVDAVFAVSRSTVGLSWCTVFEKTLRGLANWTWRLWLGFQHQCLVLIFPRMWWPDTFKHVLGETKSSDALLVGSGGHKLPIIFHFFQRHHCPFHRLMPAFWTSFEHLPC